MSDLFEGTHGEISKEDRRCYADTMTYIRTKLSLETIKSVDLCIRGYRGLLFIRVMNRTFYLVSL